LRPISQEIHWGDKEVVGEKNAADDCIASEEENGLPFQSSQSLLPELIASNPPKPH